MDKLYSAKRSHEYYVGKNRMGTWYRLPFPGSKGLKIFGSQNPRKPCNTCHVQWTAGVPFQHVSELLKLNGDKRLKEIIHRTDALCSKRKHGCRPEYNALITLASWVIRAARDCSGCSPPKRCMAPWLLRTHFGDMAMYLKDKYGKKDL